MLLLLLVISVSAFDPGPRRFAFLNSHCVVSGRKYCSNDGAKGILNSETQMTDMTELNRYPSCVLVQGQNCYTLNNWHYK